MKLRPLVALLAVSSVASASDYVSEASLNQNGLGPIKVNTVLSRDGNRVHLKATAMNATGYTLSLVRMCVYTSPGDCAFTIWNDGPWEPGKSLNWDMVAIKELLGSAHAVSLLWMEDPRPPGQRPHTETQLQPPARPFTSPPSRAAAPKPAKRRYSPDEMAAILGAISSAAAGSSMQTSANAGIVNDPLGGLVSLAGRKLMAFGGPSHEIYLGCLNCSEFASDSVFNEFGAHGSEFRTNSLLNQFGRFGSPYSGNSACNPYASDPPVVVDNKGNYYGRLTINAYKDPTKIQSLAAWIAGVCAKN
jgi:hypothetical protein